MKINENFKRLTENYLFNETARRKAEFLKREPKAEIIDLGIGDVRGLDNVFDNRPLYVERNSDFGRRNFRFGRS